MQEKKHIGNQEYFQGNIEFRKGENGIFTAPSQYETVFLSDSHTDQNITKALGAYGLSLKAVKN